MVRRDRVEELSEDLRLDRCPMLLDEPKPEVHVTEQTTLLRRPERRPAPKLGDATDVVEERGRKEEVVAQAGVQLRRLAAERRDADRVLQKSACVTVMGLGAGRREVSKTFTDGIVSRATLASVLPDPCG